MNIYIQPSYNPRGVFATVTDFLCPAEKETYLKNSPRKLSPHEYRCIHPCVYFDVIQFFDFFFQIWAFGNHFWTIGMVSAEAEQNISTQFLILNTAVVSVSRQLFSGRSNLPSYRRQNCQQNALLIIFCYWHFATDFEGVSASRCIARSQLAVHLLPRSGSARRERHVI